MIWMRVAIISGHFVASCREPVGILKLLKQRLIISLGVDCGIDGQLYQPIAFQ